MQVFPRRLSTRWLLYLVAASALATYAVIDRRNREIDAWLRFYERAAAECDRREREALAAVASKGELEMLRTASRPLPAIRAGLLAQRRSFWPLTPPIRRQAPLPPTELLLPPLEPVGPGTPPP